MAIRINSLSEKERLSYTTIPFRGVWIAKAVTLDRALDIEVVGVGSDPLGAITDANCELARFEAKISDNILQINQSMSDP